ncbi:aminodeoxychorismate synthase component I [Ornithinimicrobium sp. LYQ92]|uniref:aminodeoxychorismate synthase component I n=1 Tax=Serinicoccus sp. LYQ92 TaxID=3378798 RepID=UPI003852BABB
MAEQTPSEVLLIDNVDSFTYNIVDLLHRVLGRPPVLMGHDHPADTAELRRFAAIVVGPGPGRPQVATDMGLSDLALSQREVPVLGVCLGHQGMAHRAGEQVVEMALPRHGIVSEVAHGGTGLFVGVPSPVRVVRYHSLEVAEPLVSSLQVTARALDDGSVMALAEPGAPRWGVQFHPESVLSGHGERIIANFLDLAGVPRSGVGSGGTGEGMVAVGDALGRHDLRPGGERRRLTVRTARVPGPVDAPALHEALLGDAAGSVWLDASDGRGWSLLVDSRGPLAQELTHRVGEHPPLLDRLDELLGRWQLVGEDPSTPFGWRPGVVGYWGYELKAETGGSAAHRSRWPDAWFVLADRGVVVDHEDGDVWALWLEDAAVADEQRRWVGTVRDAVAAARPRPAAPTPAAPSTARQDQDRGASLVTARHDEQAYTRLVRRAQQEIARGESYEVCLTTSCAVTGAGLDERELYLALREASPVPRGAWLRSAGLSVLSGSPERFVSVRDGVVEARPIKGTRPRGATPDEDVALADDLATAVKDRAENLMIVDLLRNDLHRVCRTGSVHVPEIFAVESYATVHQLVSTVRGELAPGMTPTDVLRACFPGGSMTGAPKVRTMEILDALEGAARGVYSGAIGWVGANGSMDTSIVIRTLTWSDGDVTFGVGGAVTALSDPAQEYAETQDKAQAMLRAVGRAAQSG